MGNLNLLFQRNSKFLTILNFLFFLLIVVILSPLYLFRALLSVIAKFLRPELGRMLEILSSSLVPSSFTSSAPKMNLVFRCVLDGTRDKEWWTKTISAIPEIMDENGNKKYPELKKYIEMWLGYPFWREDKSFEINNHLSFLEDKTFTYSDIIQFKQDALIQPYKNKTSPWEFIIIPGLQDEDYSQNRETKTVLLLRIHHAIADGMSCVKLLVNICNNVGGRVNLKDLVAVPRHKPTLFSESMLSYLWGYIKIPIKLTQLIFLSTREQFWNLEDKDYTFEKIGITSSKISSKEIKDIKNKFNVRFMSVVFAALTASVRKAIMLKSISLPTNFQLSYSAVIPDHPDKLCNHAAMAFVSLPTGQTNSVKRLMMCEETYVNAEEVYPPENTSFYSLFAAALPAWMVKNLWAASRFGTALTHVPGPLQSLSVNGLKISDLSYVAEIYPRSCGLLFTIITYADGLRLTVIADKAVFSNKLELQKIVSAAAEEISILNAESRV